MEQISKSEVKKKNYNIQDFTVEEQKMDQIMEYYKYKHFDILKNTRLTDPLKYKDKYRDEKQERM